MIRYECGYMPLGIFSSLIIGLVSQNERNKIEFQVGDDGDSVTLISRPTYMEIVVFRESNLPSQYVLMFVTASKLHLKMSTHT